MLVACAIYIKRRLREDTEKRGGFWLGRFSEIMKEKVNFITCSKNCVYMIVNITFGKFI